LDIAELSLRIAIGFLALFAVTRIMGRKEVSRMTLFNFASAIAIGSIAGTLVTTSTFSIRNGVIALIGWGAFSILMDYIDIKSKKARKILTGDPLILIKDGRIIESTLSKTRLDLDSLNAMLRALQPKRRYFHYPLKLFRMASY